MDLDRFFLSALGAAVAAALALPAGATEILRVSSHGHEGIGAGRSVTPIPDVTGDGAAEILVGAFDPDGSSDLGSIAVYDAVNRAFVWERSFRSALDPSFDRGVSLVALGGDLDGDGVDDVAAGPPYAQADPSKPEKRESKGVVLILSGSNGRTIQRLTSAEEGERFGTVLAPAGDFDGDGSPDLLVGDPDAQSVPGTVNGGVLVVSAATGAIVARFPAPRSGERFGAALAMAGDVDGDGIADVAVGAPNASSAGAIGSGAVYVVSGSSGAILSTLHGEPFELLGASIAIAGDADGDGLTDVLAAGPTGAVRCFSLDGSLLARLSPEGTGPVAIAAGSDATGDGSPDAVLGHPMAAGETGSVEVFSLREGGGAFSFGAWNAGLGLGRPLLGYSVAFVPDMDGDGAAEIVAGSPRAEVPRTRDASGVVVIASLENEIVARAGNVNRGRGPSADVLYVADSTGGLARTISVATYVPLTVFVSVPPAATGRTPYALFARFGAPNRSDLDALPGGLGTAVFPLPLARPAPATRVVASTLPPGVLDPGARRPLRPGEPAPSIAAMLPLGTRRPMTFALQGLIADPGAANEAGLSLTNAIVVITR